MSASSDLRSLSNHFSIGSRQVGEDGRVYGNETCIWECAGLNEICV